MRYYVPVRVSVKNYRMKIVTITLSAFALSISLYLNAQDTTYYELWDIDNLENIGGHAVTFLGDPEVVTTDMGDAVQFDGDGDRLLIDANPIGEAKEFTVEVVFWPDACYPINTDPRFVHIQDPDDPKSKRVMIELRVNSENECYMDGFMNTDIENLTLVDETLTHPTETWLHAAITYKDGIFSTYMEGENELSGNVAYENAILEPTAKTSIGSRMDERNWFSGKIKTLKVTRKALDPKDFLISTHSASREKVAGKEGYAISVYPVPADHMINISSNLEGVGSLRISIKDLVGKDHYTGKVSTSEMPLSINTTQMEPGIYMVQLMAENYAETRSIIIQH